MWTSDPCPPIPLAGARSAVEARLKEKIPVFYDFSKSEGPCGSVDNGRISVFWYTPGFGNSWRPVLRGRIVGDRDGEVRIEGAFSTFRPTQVFSAIWFGGLAAIAVVAAFHRKLLMAIFGAIAMIFFGACGVALGQRLGRSEKQKIVDALQSL
jgi:hypothetical protein